MPIMRFVRFIDSVGNSGGSLRQEHHHCPSDDYVETVLGNYIISPSLLLVISNSEMALFWP